MLDYNNLKDRNKMMKYHRTKDMINLLKYFPNISPVKNLRIVESLEDYYKNKDKCIFTSNRNDNPISKPMMKSIENTGNNTDLEDIIKKIKEEDSEGVAVIFDLDCTNSERYERFAGIGVSISVKDRIIIEAVSKGFDGREVSKGIACHEIYVIPWTDIKRINIGNFKDYRIKLVNDKEYQKTRNERIKYLLSIGYDKDIIEKEVPIEYQEIPDFIWLDIIRNIIKELPEMEDELYSLGLKEIVIHGHTEGKKYMPWQMFDKTRF